MCVRTSQANVKSANDNYTTYILSKSLSFTMPNFYRNMTLIGTERFKKILLPIAENKVENNFPPTRAKILTTN